MKIVIWLGVAATRAAALAFAAIMLFIWVTDSPVRHDDT